MTQTRTTIFIHELLQRTIDGERDFSHTQLSGEERALDAQEGYSELLAYLRAQDLRAEPLVAEGADWSGLRAHDLFLPFSKLSGVDLTGADLRGAELRRADLSRSTLRGTDLSGASMIVCNLQGADLTEALLRGTDMYEASIAGASLRDADLTGAFLLRLTMKGAEVTGASMAGALFYRTDFRGVVGLESVRDLGSATFHRAMVTAVEQEAIEAALAQRLRFDLHSEA